MADEISLSPAPGLRVVWDRAATAALADVEGDQPRTWRLEGSIAPGFSALRVVSAATADGGLLLLCAARPAAAAHHDEEAISALVAVPDGPPEQISEALISTEYAADGSIRRLGLELYKPDDEYPLRAAGDAVSTTLAEEGGERREHAVLEFRLDGSDGVAHHEVVRPI